MLKTYQRKNTLFELSQDTNWEEMKRRKHDVIFHWHRYNSFVAMALLQCFCFFRLPKFATKLPSLSTKGYTGKYRIVFKDFLANENATLAVHIFS